jgi:hypothetical protein
MERPLSRGARRNSASRLAIRNGPAVTLGTELRVAARDEDELADMWLG